MAVVLTYPADPGQLGKNAAGVVAAFTATGYQNEGSGLTVTITDETLGGRILGSGASNTDPEPSGTYAGWWAFSVYCPAFDSTGASIVYLESAAAAIASAASLRVRSAAVVSGTAADSSASTETAEGYTGATSEVVLSYADGSARLRAIVGDVFSSAAADASAGEVTAGGGGGTSVSDNFNRANNSSLGASYAAVGSISGRHSISTNSARRTTSGEAADLRTETLANNQYAEALVSQVPGMNGRGCGVIVRGATGAKTFYAALAEYYDDGEGSFNNWIKLWRCVSGTWTQLGSTWTRDAGSTPWSDLGALVVRLEVSGTSLDVKTATSHAGPFTSRITATDSSISSGAAGLYSETNTSAMDDLYAGDL